uniref:hypothetical protein n=1 Tax=Methylobacterium sp. B34 TaxID=95563 RepID=UPI000FE146A0|nr:hypothetical protein [Methylobacterium sp. B34]
MTPTILVAVFLNAHGAVMSPPSVPLPYVMDFTECMNAQANRRQEILQKEQNKNSLIADVIMSCSMLGKHP